MSEPGYFEERIAAIYDEISADMFEPSVIEPTVDFLADLAGDGKALEFGIGTGRIALPLAERGVPVAGIDRSVPVVERMRGKPGGDRIPVKVGNFKSLKLGDDFSLVYLVFNTIMNLTHQLEQIACFQNAADQLRPGGRFVIEVSVPDLQRLPPGETVRPFRVSEDRLGFDEYRLVGQGLTSHHFRRAEGKWERFSIPFRYVWPSELDLMARLAGMRRVERWSGWKREPFVDDSRKLIAVWQKPAEGEPSVR